MKILILLALVLVQCNISAIQASVTDHIFWNDSCKCWYPVITVTDGYACNCIIFPGEQASDYYETGYFGLMSNINYKFHEGYIDRYFSVFIYHDRSSIDIYRVTLPAPDWEYQIVSRLVGIYEWNKEMKRDSGI